VSTGRAAIASSALWTAHLGTCAAAACVADGACALVHFDETSPGMAHRTFDCVAEFRARTGARAWTIHPGVWCTGALAQCSSALLDAGASVAVRSPRRSVVVAPRRTADF
jgi:hypothetical protein